MGVPAMGCPHPRCQALTWSHAVPHGNIAGQRPAWGKSLLWPGAAHHRLPPDPPQRRCWRGTPAERGGGHCALPSPCQQRPHGQHPPQFSGPAPEPRRWRPRPRPQLPKPPPCPACPWAPLSSLPAHGQSRAPRRAGRTRRGRALTCRGWPRTSTLRRADGGDGPGLAAQRVTPRKASARLLLHPKSLPGGLATGFGWKLLLFGIA